MRLAALFAFGYRSNVHQMLDFPGVAGSNEAKPQLPAFKEVTMIRRHLQCRVMATPKNDRENWEVLT